MTPALEKSGILLRTYTGECINVVGKIRVDVQYGGQYHRSLNLLVVQGRGPSLIGRDWLSELKKNLSLFYVDSSEQILEKHARLIEGKQRGARTGALTKRWCHRANDVLASMTGAKVFSKLDLLLQLQLEEESKECDHFHAHRYNLLPFGVAAAPAIFQRTRGGIFPTFSIGAVLSHVYEDGTDLPMAYASRSLVPAEKKYL
eukprot:Em0025g99a